MWEFGDQELYLSKNTKQTNKNKKGNKVDHHQYRQEFLHKSSSVKKILLPFVLRAKPPFLSIPWV